jgi:hypothetical protein
VSSKEFVNGHVSLPSISARRGVLGSTSDDGRVATFQTPFFPCDNRPQCLYYYPIVFPTLTSFCPLSFDIHHSPFLSIIPGRKTHVHSWLALLSSSPFSACFCSSFLLHIVYVFAQLTHPIQAKREKKIERRATNVRAFSDRVLWTRKDCDEYQRKGEQKEVKVGKVIG